MRYTPGRAGRAAICCFNRSEMVLDRMLPVYDPLAGALHPSAQPSAESTAFKSPQMSVAQRFGPLGLHSRARWPLDIPRHSGTLVHTLCREDAMAHARDVMKTDIVTASPTESVATVARRMRDRAVGAVLVVAGDSLRGIFSERDLLTRIVAEGRDPATVNVGEVATTAPVTVDADTHVRDCAAILREKGVRHLPVVEGTRPVGIISGRDFFAEVVNEFERLIDEHQYRDQLKAGVDPYEGLGGAYRD
ncbi:MAG: hypothetical protein Kow0010_09470 [Dehalococcoidia bacterium]